MVFELGKKLGVIRLDKWGDVLTTGTGHSGYVPLPGDVDSVDSYDYPLVASIVKDVTWELLTNPEGMSGVNKQREIVNNVTAAVEELIEQQVGAIVANCGLFMWLHALGIIDVAVDRAMANLTKSGKERPIRPMVALSSLTMLASFLPTLGLGELFWTDLV